mmetsp:Transcript_31473/g.73826  ORF Transcript_31473/g.73826 Transcript_31473/m.73826 type:complete len:126 (-) Transcript_31473:41-418(-)
MSSQNFRAGFVPSGWNSSEILGNDDRNGFGVLAIGWNFLGGQKVNLLEGQGLREDFGTGSILDFSLDFTTKTLRVTHNRGLSQVLEFPDLEGPVRPAISFYYAAPQVVRVIGWGDTLLVKSAAKT